MKQVLLIVFLLLFTHLAWSQFVVNPQIGINFSNPPTVTKNGITANGKVGAQAGVNFRIGNRVYFNPGIYWTLLNARLTQSGVGSIESSQQFSSFSVPLLIGVKAISTDFFSLRFAGGPTGYFIYSVKDNDFNLSRSDMKNIYAVRVGSGIDILYNFTVDVSYDIGLNTPYKTLTDIRYSPLNVMIGFKFGNDY